MQISNNPRIRTYAKEHGYEKLGKAILLLDIAYTNEAIAECDLESVEDIINVPLMEIKDILDNSSLFVKQKGLYFISKGEVKRTAPKNINYKQVAIDFYKKEVESAKGKDYYEAYRQFSLDILGKGESGIVAEGILKMKNQLTFEDFIKLIDFAEKNGVVLSSVVEAMANKKESYFANNVSVYATCRQWLKIESK